MESAKKLAMARERWKEAACRVRGIWYNIYRAAYWTYHAWHVVHTIEQQGGAAADKEQARREAEAAEAETRKVIEAVHVQDWGIAEKRARQIEAKVRGLIQWTNAIEARV